MRLFVSIPLLAFSTAFTSAASTAPSADERAKFYGTWGTPKQCSGEPIKQGGTVRAEPFEINQTWLRQGDFWCRLRWGPMEPRKDGHFTAAHAQCGEDSARTYFLGMVLTGDRLTLRWDFPHANGPLQRCFAP